MISNPEESQGSGLIPSLPDMVEQGVAEGVIGGIVSFMSHNRVNLKPTKLSESPLKAFTAKLLAEYMPKPEGYPYEESFRDCVKRLTDEEMDNLKVIYAAGEYNNLRGYCHIIGGEAVASFLEKHREKTLRIIRDIRGE